MAVETVPLVACRLIGSHSLAIDLVISMKVEKANAEGGLQQLTIGGVGVVIPQAGRAETQRGIGVKAQREVSLQAVVLSPPGLVEQLQLRGLRSLLFPSPDAARHVIVEPRLLPLLQWVLGYQRRPTEKTICRCECYRSMSRLALMQQVMLV
mgnify:CR=1 FL=1